MSHIYETEYGQRLLDYWLSEGYAVRSNVYYSDTGRFADAIVVTDMAVFAIEVENDFEAALKGVSQAALYASSARREYEDDPRPVSPLVVLPAGHADRPEAERIREETGIHILELSP